MPVLQHPRFITAHQQKPEKLSAFLGFSQAFRLPKKLTSVPKTDNLLHRA